MPVQDWMQEGVIHLVPTLLRSDKQAVVAQILSAGTAVVRSHHAYLFSSTSVPCSGSL